MAYYCVAHLFQGGDMYGKGESADPSSCSQPPPLRAEELTDEVWDFIFRGAAFPASVRADSEAGEAVRKAKREFEFWYPMVRFFRRFIFSFSFSFFFQRAEFLSLTISKTKKKKKH